MSLSNRTNMTDYVIDFRVLKNSKVMKNSHRMGGKLDELNWHRISPRGDKINRRGARYPRIC